MPNVKTGQQIPGCCDCCLYWASPRKTGRKAERKAQSLCDCLNNVEFRPLSVLENYSSVVRCGSLTLGQSPHHMEASRHHEPIRSYRLAPRHQHRRTATGRGRGRIGARPAGDFSEPGALVCRTGQAVVQSAELGVRAGVDRALRVNGVFRIPDIEAFALTSATFRRYSIFRAART